MIDSEKKFQTEYTNKQTTERRRKKIPKKEQICFVNE